MTREDIIRMAREAGYGLSLSDMHAPALERFAALVAAAEREDCAKLCDAKSEHWWAKWKHQADPFDQGASDAADECAQAIRSRK